MPLMPWRLLSAASLAEAAMLLEVRPAPTCDNCAEFMQIAMLPLVEAGLPGDQIQVVVVPWPGEQALDDVSADGVFEGGDEATAVQVCAMRNALDQPAPIDSTEIVSAVKFITCDDRAILAGVPPEARLQTCAAQAGMEYEGEGGVQACADPAEGIRIMKEPTYSGLVTATQGRPYSGPPHVFLNGQPLNCPSLTYCNSTGGERLPGTAGLTGASPLEVAGSLLDIACSFLDAPHPACAGDAAVVDAGEEEGGDDLGPTTTYCENCRLRRWELSERSAATRTSSPAPRGLRFALPFAALGLAAAAVAVAVRWRRQPRRSARAEEDGIASCSDSSLLRH